MADKNYLFGVAVVRANETALLKENDLEQLINAPDYKKAVGILCDKGYDEPEGNNYSKMLDKQLEKTWELIHKNAPDAEELNALIVKNDFQNLKATLKSEVTDNKTEDFIASPSIIEPAFLEKCVKKRRFDLLPEFIRKTAKEAFELIIQSGNGQLCDIITDKAALEAMIKFTENGADDILKEYANIFCLSANIKIAYRSAKTGKSQSFLNSALAECPLISKKELIDAALSGMDSLLDYLSANGFAEYRQSLEKGTSTFEKYCDDKLLRTVKKAKLTSFGTGPLAAFYVAKETEIKALRIILSAKLNSISGDTVRERVREMYV